ncbi:PREDICTED: non-specific lipid-transfer protein 2-like [Camelina sativa]|uniref:Non-specific lipid-transfer protein 2-like n=1 Tax=Camelina sativa TaxID=90675 RepID=A0ABM1R7A3_CAMSA|nr:PREDICTED: non-specific lipid-transfer protein 2-like [Camelina sativa]
MKFITLVFTASVLLSIVLTKPIISREEVKAACHLEDLQICKQAIITESPPSPECCKKLKEQKSCLCKYLISPPISQYIGAAKRVIAACGIHIPNC